MSSVAACAVPASTSGERFTVFSGGQAQVSTGQSIFIQTFSPFHALLVGEVLPGLRFCRPLDIVIEQDDDGAVVISDAVFGIYGAGDTPSRALLDFVQAVTEYYELLESRSHDDEHTQSLFRRLVEFVVPTVR